MPHLKLVKGHFWVFSRYSLRLKLLVRFFTWIIDQYFRGFIIFFTRIRHSREDFAFLVQLIYLYPVPHRVYSEVPQYYRQSCSAYSPSK